MKHMPKPTPARLTLSLLFLAAATTYTFADEGALTGPAADEDVERLKAKAGQLEQIEPGGFWPDTEGNHINAHGGGFYHEDGTYYWVGEAREGWASIGINLYRSNDLYNWEHVANILPTVDEEGHDLEEGCIMERPKLVYNEETGRYVLWFHLELKGEGYGSALVGVASSDTIEGPYQYHHSFRPNGHDSRDMTVYRKPDGTAYLVYASDVNFDLRVAQLTEDYLGVTERDELLFRRHREAPALFPYNGRLYLLTSACTGWNPNAPQLHVADSIWGPWEHLGNPGRGEGAGTTFYSQSTYVIPVAGKEDAFIYVGNRWRPGRLNTSPHVWLPIDLPDGANEEHPTFRWHDAWDLSYFE